MVKLQVYVAEECWTCAETRQIVADVKIRFPDVTVELLDVGHAKKPHQVFAVPTYLLNGRVIFLGNPSRDELCQILLAAQEAAAK